MHEINRVIRQAAWRVGASHFLHGLVVALTASLGVMIVLRVVERSSNVLILWERTAYVAAGACVVVGLIWAIVQRPSKLAVARRVDEGANLKESLSTALCVEPRQADDPWAKATIETATRQARGVRVGQAVPVTPPRFWPVPIAVGLALAVVFLAMPRVNWFSVGGTADKGSDPLAVIQQAKAEKLEIQNKIEEMTKNLDLPKPEEIVKPEAPKPEPATAEEVRREELKQLGSLNDRLEQLRSGAQGQKLANIQQKLSSVKPGGDKTAELAKALNAGNFAQGKAELEKLQQQAQAGAQGQGGQASQQQKEAAKQLEQIAKQLDQMAKNQDALKKQMEAAGLPTEAAQSAEAMQKAIQQASNLSAEQKQKLSEAAQAMSQSQESMQGLAQAMQEMSEAMQSGQPGGQQQQQSAQNAMQQLSELEQLSQDMASAAAAQNEAQNRMNQLAKECGGNGQCMSESAGQGMGQGQGQGQGQGNNPWSQGWASRGMQNGQRNGQGGRSGGTGDAASASYETEARKSIGTIGQGPIVGSRMIEGESIKGESRAEFVAAVTRAEQSATESIENNQIPREYHNAIKNYFGRLKSKQNPGAKAEEPMNEPPAAPASDASNKK